MLIVVVGVTSHQGDQEIWSQGKGAQVVMRDTLSRYAKCESPKGPYLSTSMEVVTTGKRSAVKAACCVWGGADGKGLRM